MVDRVIAGKFRLSRCIGIGASGAVFQADQMTLGRTVAIKILKPDLAEDPRIVQRFQDEALAASRLNHPNSVAIIDYGQTSDGLLFLVMEYLRGETLTQVIREHFPLPTERIVDLIVQVLSGLEEAHHVGVIHADLKADNIVVEHRRGDWDLAKVVDFGISRIIGSKPSDQPDQTIWGTPEYMAPEVIGGADPWVASDIYAVGVLLYELLTGATPFGNAPSVMDILTRHLNTSPLAPSQRRPDLEINKTLEAIAMRALAKPPRERFASAADFRDAVASVLGRRTQADEGELLCAGCGVVSSASFNFCPECGHARTAERPPPPGGIDAGERATGAGGVFPLPLLGRDQDTATIVGFARGHGDKAMLQLVGPAGSGRSRLLRQASRALSDNGEVRIYLANPDPTGLATPFYPIRAMVAALLELPPVCPYDGLGTALERRGLSRRDLPGIAELFGHEGELWHVEPPIRKREILAATTRVFRSAVRGEQRGLLIFEDVDLYDYPSQELLRRCGDPDNGHPLRILVSNRPDFATRWPSASVARLDLEPLDHEALTLLGEHFTRHGHSDMPDGVVLAERTDHLPSSAEQLARFVVEGGAIDSAPTSVADLIAARLERLPHHALVLCQAAAILGHESPRTVLEATLGERLDPAEFEDAISVLTARGLILADDYQVGFDRILTGEIVYDATPADVRRALHAAALPALHSSADATVLGHHHEHANQLVEAVELLTRAGDNAVHQFDDLGACQLYHRALSAARRLLLDGDNDHSRIRFVSLSIKLADALRIGGEVALARGLVEEARSYSVGSAVLEAQLLRASAHLSLTEGDNEATIATLRRAIGITIPTGQMDILAELYIDLSSAHLRNGQPEAALAELIEGIDLVTLGEGASADFGPDCIWRMLLRMAQLYNSLEKPHEASVTGLQALHHARRVRSRVGGARSQVMLANHFERTGNIQKAERYRQAAVEEMRLLGDRRGTAELLLAGVDPTRRLMRITPASLREARELADEVGWLEGLTRARLTID